MDNKQQKLKKLKLSFQKTDKRSILYGSIFATLIAITPYLFYLYESVPATQDWDTFLFTYYSTGYKDANTVMWLVTGKAIPLFLLLIWFFTCRHWWYHVLLVPIAMYLYQMISIFNEDLSYVDQFQLMHLLPIMAVVIPSIYLIRAKMFDKLNTANKSLEELEQEFMMKPKNMWEKIKQYF